MISKELIDAFDHTHNEHPVVRNQYKMLEVICNGIRYFGKEYKHKGQLYCSCICPKCGEEFTANLYQVRAGRREHQCIKDK